jgi:hypothetical protein
VDITIKKVGRRDGKDRFVLVDPRTRRVLTVNDVSEGSLRRFFTMRGAEESMIDEALQTARDRFETASASAARVSEGAETIEDDDLLFELGLDEGSDADIH